MALAALVEKRARFQFDGRMRGDDDEQNRIARLYCIALSAAGKRRPPVGICTDYRGYHTIHIWLDC
jgi:hypothetical protein